MRPAVLLCDRRKAHAMALGVQVLEDLLGAAEISHARQLVQDGLALLGHALHVWSLRGGEFSG